MYDDDDDDTFVTIGTCFEIPEDDAPLKKQSKVSDQIAVDKQGRRRFHGAFTGGFSAGYFNTAGSKEGWTPSTFVSSRSKRNEGDESNKQVQRPEDFMDEEDFSEHGIAPRRLQTRSNFKSSEDELSARKRQLKQATDEEGSESLIGGAMLDELLLPANLSIGIQILKKMGWKPGQGVGEKTEIADVPDVIKGKKVYGCMRPKERDTMDMSSFQKLLAPKDVMQISFVRKDNHHGIGYSGLDPTTAMFGGNKREEKMFSFKPTGKEKRGIKGQAFGVGAFEDDDDDIYGTDSMANYDISMTREDEKDTHGWSGAPKLEYQKGCLHGFTKSKKILRAPLQNVNLIKLPAGYVPKHVFESDKTTRENKDGQTNKNRLTSKERSLMYGETTKTLQDVNQWALKWDIKKSTGEGGEEGDGGEKGDYEKENEKASKFSSRWDKPIHQERPKVKANIINPDPEKDKKPQAPLYDVKSKTFRPFARHPEKQARYEEFLKAKKEDRDPSYRYDTSVTEWERKREHDEFVRASILYRPLNSMFANRFTPATSVDPQSVTIDSVGKETPKNTSKTDDDDMPSDKKAAKMGMFGKLTRTTHEWHPEKLLCKRFNIAEPYPGSKIRGVPSRDKKSGSSFFERNFLSIEPANDEDLKGENDDEEELDFTKNLNARQKGNQKKSFKIGPLSHLNEQMNTPHEGAPSIVSTQPSHTPSSVQKENESTKPTIDIFKAIFDNSDSSSNESSSDNDEDIVENQRNSGVTSETIDIDPSKDVDDTGNLENQSTVTTNIKNENKQPVKLNDEGYRATYRPKQEGPLAFLHRQPERNDDDDRQGHISTNRARLDNELHRTKEKSPDDVNEKMEGMERCQSRQYGDKPRNGDRRLNGTRDNDYSRSERNRTEENENTFFKGRLAERNRDERTEAYIPKGHLSERSTNDKTRDDLSKDRSSKSSRDDRTGNDISKERSSKSSRNDRTKDNRSKERLHEGRRSGRTVYRSDEPRTPSEDEWKERDESKKSSKKKKKHKHKHKKEKKHHKRKSKKQKKEKYDTDSSSGSDDDDESLVPSNTLLLSKLKEYQAATGRSRPSAADFM